MTFNLEPVGHVRCDGTGYSLQIDAPFRSALLALDGFSHLNVLWWCHHLDDPEYRAMVTTDKPYRLGPDRIGVFATRSPVRPNPIALTACPVIKIDHEAGRIDLGYIDAEDGTPILDIKPYLPATDRVREVSTPQWCAGWPHWWEESATFDWSTVFENAQ
jgi:tRNA (adenine37-N6)-methyltransferase